VSAGLNHLAPMDDGNEVSIVDGRESVGNHNAGASFPGLVQSFLDDLFALCVQCRSGFVQEEDFGVSDECTGNGYALFLSPADLRALWTNICVVGLLGDIVERLFKDKVLRNYCTTPPLLLNKNNQACRTFQLSVYGFDFFLSRLFHMR